MARKSLADRIREQGSRTQEELDRSKNIMDRVIQPVPDNRAPNPSPASSNPASQSADSLDDKSGESKGQGPAGPAPPRDSPNNVTGNATDNISGNFAVSPTASVVKPMTKNSAGSVINYHSQGHSPSGSVIQSLTRQKGASAPVFPEGQLSLTKRQKEIFQYLVNIGDEAFIQATHISQVTGIPLPTVRKTLRDLRDKAILDYHRYQQDGRKGIVYSLNMAAKAKALEAPSKKSVTVSVIKRSVTESLTAPINSSSSFSLNDTTTADLTDIRKVLQSRPEMGYWRQKGLTEKQVAEWMKVADCNLDRMATYLDYCRFEMVEMGLEQSKPIHDVFNWFFKILERSGQYRKPKGYKSHLERKLEAEKEVLEAQKQRIEELKSLKRREWEQAQELEFWEMLNNPEGDLYAKCFARLNNFDRKRARKGGKAFEMAMRRAYDQMVNQETGADEAGEGG
jgi:DNA-binding transcriptional ArsR family regulator